MRFIPWLVFGLLTAAVAHAELKLVADVDDRHLPVVGIGDSGILVEDTGGRTVLPATSNYLIEGDLVAGADLVAWSPSYSIQRQESPDGPSFTGHVAIRHLSEWNGRKLDSAFLKVWPGGVKDRGLVVAAWLTGGKITQVAVMPIQSTVRNAFEEVTHSFALTGSEVDGQAILLLWQDGRFVPPAVRFENAAAEKVLPAAVLGDTATVRTALEAGLKVGASDRDGGTLLLFAAEAGATDVVDLLLARGAKPNVKTRDGSTALLWAAGKGRSAVVERLLAAGASPTGTDDGQPLIDAIKNGHDPIARLLIAAKAPVNRQNTFHESAFTVAVDEGNADLAELMYARANREALQADQSCRVLITQAALGHAGMVAFLVKHGVPAKAEDRGFSALRAGAWHGSAEIARVLLEAGSPVDRADALGRTALMNAALAGNVDYARVLLEAGANPSARDKQGAGCLNFAATRGSRELTQMLLDRGVDARGVPTDLYRPVELALIIGSAEVVQLLATHGAILDPQSKHFTESMVAALRMDMPDLVQSALVAGWSPAKPLDGWSAMRLAEAFHAKKTLARLRAAGAIDFSTDLPPITSADALDHPPRVTVAVNPEDPRSLDQTYPKALVEIDGILSPDGRLLFPTIRRSDDPQLALGTLLTMAQWRFTPATLRGAPAFAAIRIPVEFPSSVNRVIAANQADVPARLVKTVPPVYPAELKRSGTVGRVVLRFTVDKLGVVQDLRVVSSSNPGFEAAALRAVKAWRFEPGLFNGAPANCEMEEAVLFNLSR